MHRLPCLIDVFKKRLTPVGVRAAEIGALLTVPLIPQTRCASQVMNGAVNRAGVMAGVEGARSSVDRRGESLDVVACVVSQLVVRDLGGEGFGWFVEVVVVVVVVGWVVGVSRVGGLKLGLQEELVVIVVVVVVVGGHVVSALL